MTKDAVLQRMCASGILPVFRTDNLANLIPATRAFYDAGIGCAEYTMTMPNALEMLREAVRTLPSDCFLGLGTVLDAQTVDTAVAAGAKFIASPGLRAEVVEACVRHNVVCVAGIMTPSEIMEALRLGADVMKVFPSAAVGPEFFSDVLGPFPGLHLMAASKSAMDNHRVYIQAGAEIITCVGNLLDVKAYESGDFATIQRKAAALVESIRNARQGK